MSNENNIKIENQINNGAVPPFKITKDGVDYLIQKYLNRKFTEDIDYIERVDGVKFFEEGLSTSFERGLVESIEKREIRISEFDTNEDPPEEPISFCDFYIESLGDKIIIILLIAAVVELIIGSIFDENAEFKENGVSLPNLGWIDGVSVLLAVAVVTLVGSINNYNKEVEFRKMKLEFRSERKVYIRRNGDWVEDSEQNLLVGDILKIESGITIPVDCLLIEGQAEIDESAMTGEIDPILKTTFEASLEKKEEVLEKHKKQGKEISHGHHLVESPLILSGTQVNHGDGCALVLAVGSNSENGKIRETINANKSSGEGTPLQQKLADLADRIGWAGLVCAILTSVGMALNLGISVAVGKIHGVSKEPMMIIDIFIIGIIVVVVAIPEGLPLAVTMTLAFSIRKMLLDNCFVRRMESCETMGNAEYVCTDKTGTLTKNEMMMTKLFNFGEKDKNLGETVSNSYKGNPESLFEKDEWEMLMLSLACNTNTTFDADGNEKGNKSDESLTKFLSKFGVNVKEVREEYIKPVNGEKPQIVFTSSRKKMSTLISHKSLPTKYRLLIKGASEIILKGCNKIRKPTGKVEEMTKSVENMINEKIGEYARETLRTFSIAYKDLTENDLEKYFEEYVNDKNMKIRPIEEADLTLIAIIGIKDHMKDGVPEAISSCNRAGIKVIMITGDNIETAFAIAKNCNIATKKEQTILGDEFMKRIGGVVCLNCKDSKDSKGSKDKEGDSIVTTCLCPRSKDEWIMKYKQNERKALRNSNPGRYREILDDDFEKEKYEENLNENAFKEFENKKIKPKVDAISNIEAFKEIIFDLKVIARSQPQHKYALITGLRQLEHVVAVTGDGTNDAPALSKSDVGFAMDAGTDIAKEASDIVIKDNEFKSIVKAVLWGRNVFDSIRKFLQFQLTVNVSACILVTVGASVGSKSPLTAIQMLWVNMIMDSLGSLALASEKPYDGLLNRKPNKKTDFIINRKMAKHIAGQAIYQLIVLFIILFSANRWLPEYDPKWQKITYDMKYCFDEAPIFYKDELKPENMYVLTGMKTFYYDTIYRKNITYCIDPDNLAFGNAMNLKDAFRKVIVRNYGTPHYSIIFNTFVFMQLFNEICSRIIDDSKNIFDRINTNILFIVLWFCEAILQIVIIIFTGPVFHVAKYPGISGEHWGICIAFAFITFIVNYILKILPDPCMKEEGDAVQVGSSVNKEGIISQIRQSKAISKQISRKISKKAVSRNVKKVESSKEVKEMKNVDATEQQNLHVVDEEKSGQI